MLTYVLLITTATFRSYPEVVLAVLPAAWLPAVAHAAARMRYPFSVIQGNVFVSFLAPVFFNLWMNGAGNANFFFNATLIFAVAQGIGRVVGFCFVFHVSVVADYSPSHPSFGC